MDEIGNIKNKINIRDINSSFIIKNIFSFVSEKQILNMIRYNKQLQILILVNIENFKKLNGKYKKGEKNGKGKEYLVESNKLILEGEYLNGKRSGKGKEYYEDGHLLYEGEYLSNKKTNGKIYYYDYCGEYIYEVKNGVEGKIISQKLNKIYI